MPTKQTKIHAQFPTFDQQSEEIKSLINFFMEGASVFFHGKYEDPNVTNKMTSYTGEIRFNNRPISSYFADYTPFEMIIPYQNYFDGDFPSFDIAPQSDLSESDLPYVTENDPIRVEDGVVEYTVPSLTSVKTAMNLYCGQTGTEGSTYFPTSRFVEENTISIPVQLIPKVNDAVNTDTRLKPKQIATKQANSDGLYLQKIPIEDILDSEGNPISDGFVYDFQLRTPTFGVRNDKLVGASAEEVFYKIGLTRLDTSIDLETIVDVLKTASLHIKTTEYVNDNIHYASFSLVSASDHSSSPDYALSPDENPIEQHIGTGNINGIAPRAIMAVRNSSGSVVALLYMRMYKADGSDYTGLIDHKDFTIFDAEDLEHGVNSLNLDLTDQDVDPVPAPESNPEP